jgi:monothiol glutaredoxin
MAPHPAASGGLLPPASAPLWPGPQTRIAVQTTPASGIGLPGQPLALQHTCSLFSKQDSSMSDVQQRIDDLVKGNRVVLFMKGTAQFPMCGFSGRAIQILKASGVTDLKTFNVLEDEEVRQGIKDYAQWPTIPQLYINGEFLGGSDIMMEMYESGELQQVLGAG